MLISIVLPTFNRAHVLDRAIDSVIKQTYTQWELVIIDNYSNDQTDDLIKSYQNPKIRIIKINNSGIIAKSRNLGIKKSRGEVIAFLDSDDWWAEKKLEYSLKYLFEYNADIVYHDLYEVKSEIFSLFHKKRKTKRLLTPVFEDLIKNGNTICNSSVVVRKKLLEKIGFISEEPTKKTWEDYDTWIRLSKVTDEFMRIPKTLGYYWIGTGTLSSHTQTIRNIAMIKSYLKSSYAINNVDCNWWMNYYTSRAYYHMKEYVLAKDFLKKVHRSPLDVWIKKHLMLFNCYHKIFLNRFFCC